MHPENDAVIAQRKAEFVKKGQTSPIFHALSRPAECEAEAIGRMINLAHICGNAPLYIVHLSNGLSRLPEDGESPPPAGLDRNLSAVSVP